MPCTRHTACQTTTRGHHDVGPGRAAYAGVMITLGVQFLSTPIYGIISDRVRRRPVYTWSAGLLVLFAFPFPYRRPDGQLMYFNRTATGPIRTGTEWTSRR